ncbi:hypothetical protein Zmor_008735 [Zophobas morio]|uniref:CCAAT-binding factor domain-containing protein n=1 Tax=Zophobas morio TaxID=2755281 RepID=A0AA38M039_9CUCU|nr:hypothetical protein Zmor_008735 [Zophobas morio]
MADLGEKNSSDLNWMSTVAASGTFHDKLAAKIVLMQESMIHNLDSLLSVILLTQKKKRESLKALDCLKSLWITDLLPENRKLKFFYEQNLYDAASSDAHLLLIYFEDQVKVAYSTYLQALEKHLSDSQYSIKNNLIQILLELLIERPEQEKVLLSLLVNKMGDPDRQLASKISHYLNRLLQRHPRMKLVIVNEVEQFLRRPNMTLQAQYYSVCFLNQILLHRNDTVLPNKLLDIYFFMFTLLSKEAAVDHKILNALLVGVNRALPFSSAEGEPLKDNIDTLFRLAHTTTFVTSIQALAILFQVMLAQSALSDRFYRCLYQKLLDCFMLSDLRNSASFYNLLYKSLYLDSRAERVHAFVKRLLQLCLVQRPHQACAILFLISTLAQVKPAVLRVLQRDPQLADHYHPSVRSFAEQLLKGKPIQYRGDPLADFTLLRFLDKFVHKNPKQNVKAPSTVFQKRTPAAGVLLDPKELLNMRETDVAADDMFMYNFFKDKGKTKKISKKKKKEKVLDVEENLYSELCGEPFESDEDITDGACSDASLEEFGRRNSKDSFKAKPERYYCSSSCAYQHQPPLFSTTVADSTRAVEMKKESRSSIDSAFAALDDYEHLIGASSSRKKKELDKFAKTNKVETR